MKQNNAVTKVELVENANEGDDITVTYNSAHSDDTQKITGEVLEAERLWNDKGAQAEFKNSEGIYKIIVSDDDDTASLERNSYNWHRGERTQKTGTVSLTESMDSDPVKAVEVVDNSPTHTCWECGEDFDREADHNHHVQVAH